MTPLRPAQAGGAQAFVADLAQALAGRGHDVRLYCAEGSEVPGVELRTVPVEPAIAKALVRPAGVTAERVLAVARAFAAAFDLVRRDGADAVSQHAFDAEAIELAEGLPVLHTLHLGPIAGAVVAAARRTGAPLAVPSEAARREWQAAGLSTSVLRNGTPDFDPAGAEVGGFALIAGRVSPEKGTVAGIRAARGAGLRPLVVGDVYDPAYHQGQVLALLGPGELLPVLPREQLWRVMARATVTLMPVEWEEPFGLVAAESQVAGCPVVAYARGALPEVVEDGVGGVLVSPGDFDGFVRAIGTAARLDRAAVRRSARERLLIDGAAAGYERALQEVGRA